MKSMIYEIIAKAIKTTPIAKMSYCPFPQGPTQKKTIEIIPAIIQRIGNKMGQTFFKFSFIVNIIA